MTPEMNVFLLTLTLAAGLASWLLVARRRRPRPLALPDLPRRRVTIYWYAIRYGFMSWDCTYPDGRVEHGPLFYEKDAYEIMDNRWILDPAARGPNETIADLSRWFDDVMCYYPRGRERWPGAY